jgi:acyl-coenzyme A synthetase/AMP-(fatty) acid ligase
MAQASVTFGDQPFLRGATTLSYRAAETAINRRARQLLSMGVQRGDRVLAIGHNRVGLVVLALAAIHVGAVIVILHPQTRLPQLSWILAKTEPRVVFGEPGTPALDCAVYEPLSDADLIGPDGTTTPVAPTRQSDLLALIYTSGSTGFPRGVMVNHENVLFTTHAIQRRLRYRSTDIIGLFLPMSFDYGFYQIFLAMNSGASVFIGGPGSFGRGLPALLDRNEISVLPLVPSQIIALTSMLGRRSHILRGLRTITSTGDHFPVAESGRLRELLPHVSIHSMYGLTECKRATILTHEEYPNAPDSVGRALDDTRIDAVDPSGNPLPAGQVGELVVSGPNVTLGYWRNPAATKARFHRDPSGVRKLMTGDFGWIDSRGYVRVLGRKDRLIKRRGFRISLAEVERAAISTGLVRDAAAIFHSARIHLFVQATGDTSRGALFARLSALLEPYKLPEGIHFMDGLPMTENQKVDHSALLAGLRKNRG